MRNLYIVILFIIMTQISCTANNDSFVSVANDEFEIVMSQKNVVVLDVRTAEEYAEGHLPNAINIDVLKDDFESKATSVLPGSTPVALYCRSGNRSKKAATILAGKGYSVTELQKGYNGWAEAGKPVTKEEADLFYTKQGTPVYMYCIKHGSVKMKIGEKWLYVDPVTDKVPPVTDFMSMPKADYILITHEHPDHLDAKAIKQLQKDETILVINPSSSEILKKDATISFKREIILKNNETKNISTSLIVDAVPAYNNSADKQMFHPKGRDNGYVLSLEGMKIYIAGDTEDIPEMAELKDVDVAFLPCNLPFTMTPGQLAKAAKSFMPKVLFPYHYGQTEINQVVNLLSDSGIDVRIRQYQ